MTEFVLKLCAHNNVTKTVAVLLYVKLSIPRPPFCYVKSYQNTINNFLVQEVVFDKSNYKKTSKSVSL